MQGLLIYNIEEVNARENYATWMRYNYDAIQSLLKRQFQKEDLYNKAYLNRIVMQYYLAFYLVWMVADEYYNSTNKDWNYYLEKYDLENKRKALGCNGISLEKLLEIFGFAKTIDNLFGGINSNEISSTFVAGDHDEIITVKP